MSLDIVRGNSLTFFHKKRSSRSCADCLPRQRFRGPAPEKVRTIEEIPGFPLRVLKRTISPTIYKHLRVSPVEAWVEVRARLSGTHLYGARVIHSEADGAYDGYALRLARETEIADFSPWATFTPPRRW